MDSLIKSLPTILRAAGDSAEVAEEACKAAWKHAVGEGLRAHAVPLRFSQKTLVVGVADSTWQKQLQSLSGQLLLRLHSILGQPLITFLDFRVDPNAVAKVGGHGQGKQIDCRKDESKAISVELLTAAAQIQDPDLRRAFLGAAESCLKRLENAG